MAQASQPATPTRSRESTAHPDPERLKDQRVADLQRQLADLQSLFVTSTNVENRRQSLLPPRPVSPTKLRAPSNGSDDSDAGPGLGGQDLTEQVLDLRDEVEALTEERAGLLARVTELEARTEAGGAGEESEVVARLRRENQELLVVAQNADGEAQLRAMERRSERKLEKCRKYEEDLEESLKAERKVSIKSWLQPPTPTPTPHPPRLTQTHPRIASRSACTSSSASSSSTLPPRLTPSPARVAGRASRARTPT